MLVLEIGDASVAAALVLLSHTAPPRILYTTRTRVANHATLDFNYLINSLKRRIDEVTEDVATRGVRQSALSDARSVRIRRVLCVLSPLWHASHSRQVTIARGVPFNMTREVLERAIEKEVDEFTAGHAQAHIRAGIESGSLSLIEKETLNSAVNGYTVSNPQGHTGSKLELLLYISVAQNSVASSVREAVRRAFSIDESDISFHSSTLALFRVTRAIYPEEQDCILVEIGDEITSVGVVNGGMLLETATFPLGKNSIIRGTASRLSVSPEEAASLLKRALHESPGEDGSMIPEAEAAWREQYKNWIDHLDVMLNNLSAGLFLPHTMLVATNDMFALWFVRLLEDEALNRFTMVNQPFTVHRVTREDLAQFVEVGQGARRDPNSIMSALFADMRLGRYNEE